MIQWHVFISVPQHYNPYSGNFVWRASSPTWPTTDYNPTHMLRHTGMCRPNGLLFHQKILRYGSHFDQKNP